MTSILASDYWWGSGHIAYASFDNTYAVTAFPVQSDQAHYRWFAPGAQVSVLPASVPTSISGKRKAYGGYRFTWRLGPLSQGMVSWLRTNRFSSNYSNEATIRTWDRERGFTIFHCTALWPEDPEPFRAINPGYILTVQFIKGERQTAP